MQGENDVHPGNLPELPPIIEHVPAVALRLSHDGDNWQTWFVTKNVSMYGYEAEDFYAGRVQWLDIVHPDDRVLLSKTVNDYEAHGVNSFRVYYRVVTKDHRESIPVTEYNTINRDKDGRIICYDTVIVSNTHSDESRRLIDDYQRQQSVLNDILMSLHDSDPDRALQIILDRTGAYLNTSRALLFKDSPDHKTCKIVYEWLNTDIESVMALNYSITYATGMPEIYVALQTTGNLIIDYGAIPDNCKEEFEAEGLIASAIFAVYLNGDHYGFVCFDDCVVERHWDDETVRFLKNVSNLISTVLARRAADEQLVFNQRTYEAVLDNVDSYIFVVDPVDNRVVFANKSFKDAFGEACVGRNADEYLRVSDIANIAPTGGEQAPAYPEVYSQRTNEWLAIAAEEMPWVDGTPVRLINCYDTTASKMYAASVERLAFLDHLTGLPNRYRCDTELKAALAQAMESGRTGYLLFIDMDDFKVVNDSYGHDYGDAILISFADYLKNAFPEPDRVFRFGGDEFVILLSHQHDVDIHKVLAKLQARGAKPWHAKGKDFFCTLSMGVVKYPGGEESATDVVKHADIALYEAKRKGKNQYEFYAKDLADSSMQRSEMESVLRGAMQDSFSGFVIQYQPTTNAHTGAVDGAEALLRIRRDGQLIPPDDFLALANYLGFMVPIGEHVLREAARVCKAVVDAGNSAFSMTVNLSAKQMSQKDIVQLIEGVLNEHGLAPGNLAIAILETDALADPNRMLKLGHGLKALGVKVILGDFGAGNASFIQLRDLPVDMIKLSTAFMNRLDDRFTLEFIDLVVKLSHSIGIKVAAGGIETQAQCDYARGMGADELQGFYFHASMHADELLGLLSTN